MKNFHGKNNIVHNTSTLGVETVGISTQTRDNKHMKYTQTPEMYSDNTSTQRQPIQHFEHGTSTN